MAEGWEVVYLTMEDFHHAAAEALGADLDTMRSILTASSRTAASMHPDPEVWWRGRASTSGDYSSSIFRINCAGTPA